MPPSWHALYIQPYTLTMPAQSTFKHSLLFSCTFWMFTALAEAFYHAQNPLYSVVLHAWLSFFSAVCIFFITRSHTHLRVVFFPHTHLLGLCAVFYFYFWRDVFLEKKIWLPTWVCMFFLSYVWLLPWVRKAYIKIHFPVSYTITLCITVTCAHTVFLTHPHTPTPTHNKAPTSSGVVLIIADTLRADAVLNPAKTPFLHALMQKSDVWSHAYAQASWTKPSVASMFTSLQPSEHHTNHKYSSLGDSYVTVAKHFQKQAYTGFITANYNVSKDFGFHKYFDFFKYLPPTPFLNAPPHTQPIVLYQILRFLHASCFTPENPSYFYQNGLAINQEAWHFFSEVPTHKPFLLVLHYMDAHDPYTLGNHTLWSHQQHPHPSAEEASVLKQAYERNVQKLDTHIQQLFEGLKKRGLDKTTTVLFTSDHGESFNEHGTFYHGTSLYDEQIHIPFWITPAQKQPRTVPSFAQHIDIAPTLADVLHTSPHPSWKGVSVYHPTHSQTSVLSETFHQGHVLKSLHTLDGEKHLKYILHQRNNVLSKTEKWLFNIDDDPQEKHPLPIQKFPFLITHEKHPLKISPLKYDEALLKSLGYVQ